MWPGDLVFEPTWPSFKLDLEIIKTNILSMIHDDCFKNVTARLLTRFSADLARWPSFQPPVNQFQTWPRTHQDKYFEQDSWWLLQKCDHYSVNKVSLDLAWWPSFLPQVTQFQTWPRNHQDKQFEQDSWWLLEMWPLECWQGFPLIWPGDLTFDPKWPTFELDLEIIKTNILSKIHDDCFKHVTARVSTRFSADLAWWPSFWPQVTQFRTWPRSHQTLWARSMMTA